MTAGIADAAQLADPAAVLGLLTTRPRLLAPGEPTHGEDALLDLRNDPFRHPVEQEGYRTIRARRRSRLPARLPGHAQLLHRRRAGS